MKKTVLATLNDAARSPHSTHYNFSQGQDAALALLTASVALRAFVSSDYYTYNIGKAITVTALAGGVLMPLVMTQERATYLCKEFFPISTLSSLGTCVAFSDIINGPHVLKRGSILLVIGWSLGSATYGALQYFKLPSHQSTDDTAALTRTRK
jgi:hypothetical protein